jgi:poly(3-hydroxybutyrate) depolymerase
MMLYEFYEAQRALMSPFSEFASASSKLYRHPLSLFAHVPNAHRVSAGLDLMHRLAKDYEKPQFDIRDVDVDGVQVAVHERVAVEKPFCRLLRFKRFTDDLATLRKLKGQPTVLVVAPLSGHHSTLLRETVPRAAEGPQGLHHRLGRRRMVPEDQGPVPPRRLRRLRAGVHPLHRPRGERDLGLPADGSRARRGLADGERGEQSPRTLTMMGGPIDARRARPRSTTSRPTRACPGSRTTSSTASGQLSGAGRRVYPGFLQHAGFIAMNPDRHLKSHYDYFLDLVRGDGDSAEFHRDFYDEYNAVLDMPAEYYLDTIKTVFQDFALVNGSWVIDGQPVRPQDIKTAALLTIEGELDDISGAGQTRAAHELCTGIPADRRFHYDALGAGHYGIFSGRRWRENVYPKVREFIAAHQEPAPRRAPRAKRRSVSA